MKLSVYRDNQLVGTHDLEQFLAERPGTQSFEFTIGRSQDSFLLLEGHEISRHHASILFSPTDWILRKNTNFGTLLLNGSEFESSVLKNSDMITIGSYHVVISEIKNKRDFVENTPNEVLIADMPNAPTDEDLPELSTPNSTEDATQMLSQAVQNNIDDLETAKKEGEGDFDEVSGFRISELDGLPDPDDDLKNNIDEEEEFSFEEPAEVDSDLEENTESEQENQFESEAFGTDVFAADTEANDHDGFGIEEFGDAGEATQVVSSFANFELQIFGEYAPYDRFRISEQETFIGRDSSQCQLSIDDPEVSTKHALIKKSLASCTLVDLGSVNGTILNGERINEVVLGHGDEFIIGSTTFTFLVDSALIKEEAGHLMPVDQNQVMEVEEVIEEEVEFGEGEFAEGEGGEFATEGVSGGNSLRDKWNRMEPRRKVIWALFVVMAIMMIPTDEEPKKVPPKTAKKQKKQSDNTKDRKGKKKRELTPEELEYVERNYQVGKSQLDEGKYRQAKISFRNVQKLDPSYKEVQTLIGLADEGFKDLEDAEKKRRREEERKIRQKQVKVLVEKARKAVEDKKVQLAEGLFSKIYELDPDNLDVEQMKLEIDAWKKEQERKALAKSIKEAERKRQLDLLAPGKTFYLKREWYKAIIKLDEFLAIKKLDEDLIEEASKMLSESKRNLEGLIKPLLGKARSLKEGRDLKNAYSIYQEILGIHPAYNEAIDEINAIRDILERRSMKLYREALISESLSLFSEAKEKFQEVQQISPIDSDYYKKASEKLKTYWD